MILILSTSTDRDTNLVMEWLNYNKTSIFRLNDEELMSGIIKFYYNPKNKEESYFQSSTKKIFIREISMVWFRKFGFLTHYEYQLESYPGLNGFILSEFRGLEILIFNLLEKKIWFNNWKYRKSKLEFLEIAHNSNLNIPNTLVTTQKRELESFFYNNNSSIITKPITEGRFINVGKSFVLSTQKIIELETIQDYFSPSFFQEYIDKEFEIRVFYINGDLYSMAIFSQQNPKTKIDFRNYDLEKPNRFVPYKLPFFLEKQVISFMKKANLETGSLDIVKSSRDGKYYFLEVNPSGQFGTVSLRCNYNLHKIVAENLILFKNENQ